MATQSPINAGSLSVNGELLIGSGTGRPLPNTIDTGLNMTVTNTAGGITLENTNDYSWRVISYQNITSSTATVNFDNVLSAAYQTYILMFQGINVTTDSVSINLRFGTGATPTYHSGATDYEYHGLGDFQDTKVQNTAASEISLTYDGQLLGNGASEGAFSGCLWIFSSQSAKLTQIRSMHTYRSDDSGDTISGYGSGSYLGTTVTTSLRIFASSGNIDGGSFTLVGIGEG